MKMGLVAGSLVAALVWSGVGWGQEAAGEPTSPVPIEGEATQQEAAEPATAEPVSEPPAKSREVERTEVRDEIEEPVPPPKHSNANGESPDYFHDGLYLRLSLGASYLDVSGEIDPGGIEFGLKGPGMGLDVMVGGTPTPGLVVGGSYWFNQSSGPDFEFAGTTSSVDADLNFGVIGIFIDGFPAPNGGFHIGGTLGFAAATVSTGGATNEGGDRGFGAGAFLGYDAWVAKQWALGGLVRATYAGLSNSENGVDEKLKVTNLALLFTALHH
jgi:hypothetical protein